MSEKPNDKELVSKFEKETLALGGQVHVASNELELVKIILGVAKHANCKAAVIDKLLIGSEKIRSTLIENGITTVFSGETSSAAPEILADADIGITQADVAIAQTGTIIMKTTDDKARLVSCLPRIHVALVNTSRLVRKLTDATEHVESWLRASEPCVVSFVSGPSRTSDIEMKHILGVHGPHQVHVILYEG
jgi:L-lactate dehydrogenase complex protein LldG